MNVSQGRESSAWDCLSQSRERTMPEQCRVISMMCVKDVRQDKMSSDFLFVNNLRNSRKVPDVGMLLQPFLANLSAVSLPWRYM